MSSECWCPLCGRCNIMHTCQWYYEVITLPSDCLLVRFKLSVLMYGVHNGISPSHLTDTTTPISSLLGHRQLRSAMTTEYDIPRTRTTFGVRAFFVAGPREWNALPADIRNIIDLSSFKRAIKTLLLYWHIRIKQYSRLYYVRRFWIIFRGCKMRHTNEVYLLTYLRMHLWRHGRRKRAPRTIVSKEWSETYQTFTT